MLATAFPYPGCDPFLMEEEPFDRPGNDAIGTEFIRPPIVFDRLVDAQARKFRRIAEPVDVLRRLARPARVRSDGRIDDKHADIRVGQKPAVENPPGEIDDSNAVGLANRPQRAFPDTDPSGM